MIRYALNCANGHSFEEWFDNSADYDTKVEAKSITCPDCGGHEISKAIMAPSIGKKAAAPAPACPATGCGGGGCPMMGAL